MRFVSRGKILFFPVAALGMAIVIQAGPGIAGEESTPITPADTAVRTQPIPYIEPPAKSGQVPEVPLSKARIKFDDSEFDFGGIPKGTKVSHNYWFTNAGTEDLVITKVKPACGCTTTRQRGMRIAPGERGSIDIAFDSGRFNGKVTKGITVECNDELNPYMELRFSALVNNPFQSLESSPLEANFETVPMGKSGSLSLLITNVDSTASKIMIVEKPSPDFIQTKLSKTLLKPKASTEIKLALASNLTPGPFMSSLTIEAESKPDSRITIPILGTIDEAKTAARPDTIK